MKTYILYRGRYKNAREKVRKLNDNLNERSKAIKSSSTTDAEAETPFIEADERDKLLPLRELKGLDKQLRKIRRSLKVEIAKRIDLKGPTEHEERKLSEVQDPIYSDDQITMIEDRIKKLRDELNERNEEIGILKGEASKQINQMRGSITKFLDKKTGTLGARVKNPF